MIDYDLISSTLRNFGEGKPRINKKEFFTFCENKFDDVKFLNTLQEEAVRIRSNTIMGRLMEFGIFTKEPKFKSGPYTRMQNISELAQKLDEK